ncbi:MAG: hypothetical protein IPK75_10670 [Acidobacteria bacterium]|nr:hypothetical protein [Acidobacteriota bacterium]
MHYGEILSLLGLGFGALLGLGALFSPDWAARFVRLKADPERPGGYSEFRATYGGLFLMAHLMTFLLVLQAPETVAVFAVLPLAAGWLGAAMGRAFSLVLDRDKGSGARIVLIWMGSEILLALAIAAPILQFTG